MKKCFLLSKVLFFALMLMGVSTAAKAVTTAYAVQSGASNIMKFDAETQLSATAAFTIGSNYALTGTIIDGKYYILSEDADEVAYWGVFDFGTKEYTVLASDVSTVKDITYDASTQTIYGHKGTVIYTIDKETGALTSWYDAGARSGITFFGIAADGKGGLYAVQRTAKMENGAVSQKTEFVHFAADKTIDKTVAFALPAGHKTQQSNSSMALAADGTLYYLIQCTLEGDYMQRTILTKVDPETAAVTVVDNQSYTETLALMGLSFYEGKTETPDTPIDPNAPVTMIQTIYEYGDIQGAGEDNLKKVDVYYYGADNRLLRRILSNVTHNSVTNGEETIDSLGYEPYQYYRYRTTIKEDGTRVVESHNRKNVAGVGSYDEFDRYWQKYSPNTFSQETYDKDGVLIQSFDTYTGDSAFYHYEDGNLLEKINFYYTTGALNNRKKSVEKYSNFVEGKKNCPQLITISSRYSASATVAEASYNERGQIIEKITYKAVVGNADKDGLYESAVKGDPKQKEQWTYNENGDMLEHLTLKYKNGEYVNANRTAYTINGMRTKEVSYFWDRTEQGEMKWMTNGTWKETEKSTFIATSALKNLTVTQSADDVKQFILHADVPEVNIDYRYDVYRDGAYVGQMLPNAEVGKMEYIDNDVYNGLHDWFVQTVSTTDETGLNISEATEIDVFTALNPVTVARIASNVIDVEDGYNVVTFEWDAPETPGALLKGYNFYANVVNINRASPQNTALLTERTYEMKWQADRINNTNNVKDYYVEAVYDLGKVKSEKFEVELPIMTGIDDVAAASATLSLDNKVLTVRGAKCNIVVYAANGSQVAATNAAILDLSACAPGVYMVVVKANGTSNTIKIVL